MRIGCVLTVKNEQDTLLDNINYHRYIGVTDFFIYLDDSSDQTREMIKSLPNLTFFEGLTFEDLLEYNQDKPEVEMDLIERFYATHLSLRQIVNANMALELCREQDIGWLVHLDTDELICVDTAEVRKDGLKQFFDQLDRGVESVSFKNIEAVPREVELSNPYQVCLFKCPGADLGQGNFPKSELFDPFKNHPIPAGWFWGHTSNKSAVRTAGNAYFITPHRCHTDGEILHSEYLLHYNITSYKQWLNKYRNFANYPEKRRARPLRLLQVAVVNHGGFTEEELRDYFARHVIYSEEEIEEIQALDPQAFLEIHAVANFMLRQEKATGHWWPL
jgi:hypothetical protein